MTAPTSPPSRRPGWLRPRFLVLIMLAVGLAAVAGSAAGTGFFGILGAPNGTATGQAATACHWPVEGLFPPVGYGRSVYDGDVACTVLESGVTCWDTPSGASFALNRAGYVLGSDGPVPAAQMP